MLDQSQRWATMTDFATIKTSMKEYFITGKTPADIKKEKAEIKQRALLLKIQEREINSCYGSSLQTRQQKRFPMDHSRQETIQTVQNKKNRRKEILTTVTKASVDSRSLRMHSLKMFDDAVFGQGGFKNSKPLQNHQTLSNGHTGLNTKQTCVSIRPQTACNNGPSQENMFYQSRGKVLNSIRLRPKSEPPVRYNHEKWKTVPAEIQRTLCQSNNEFRVKIATQASSTAGTRPSSFYSCSSTVSDFKLVPVSESLSEQSCMLESGTENSLQLCSSAENVFHENDYNVIHDEDDYDDTSKSRASSSKYSSDMAFRKRNVVTGPVHYYSLEYESSSEGSINEKQNENKPPPVEEVPPPPPEDPRPKSGKKVKGAKAKAKPKSPAGKRKGKEQEKPSQIPEVAQPIVVENAVVRKPLKGPRCWVDDATITSDIDPSYQDGVLNDPSPGQHTPCVKIVTTKDKQEIVIPNKTTTLVNNTNLAQNITGILHTSNKLDNSKVQIENQEDVNTDEVTLPLPRYICPSSVRKSKHAAIKDWLSKTDFCHAERSVPLL